jgi:hypothetical protein
MYCLESDIGALCLQPCQRIERLVLGDADGLDDVKLFTNQM